MMTRKELHDELWLLTKGMLQDSRIETTEATVVKRWLEEHQLVDEFKFTVEKLDRFLADGYIDRFESKDVCDMIGNVLTTLRREALSEASA